MRVAVLGAGAGGAAAVAELITAGHEVSLWGRSPGTLEPFQRQSGVAYECDVVLYSEFTSQQALDAYARHSEHLRVRDELRDIRIARHQVDYVPSTE